MENISDRLKKAMKIRGFSNYKLWQLSGTSEATIGRLIKNPETKPNESTLLSLSNALKVNFDWLLLGTGEMEIENKANSSQKEIGNDSTTVNILVRRLDEAYNTIERLQKQLDHRNNN